MTIDLPEGFYPRFKYKHILLDTTVFIDGFSHPNEFLAFFDKLNEQYVTFVTIVPVRIEFLRGNPDPNKFAKKEEYISSIVDSDLPIHPVHFKLMSKLNIELKEDNKNVSITDLLLGTQLMDHQKDLYLFTRNTCDFPTNVYCRETYFNISDRKSILSYGVYTYPTRSNC
jgi:predicted nucleic acid-binding protein